MLHHTEIPPLRLRKKVHGSENQRDFLYRGARIARDLQNQIERYNVKGRLLDFGCGCGRVMSHWDLTGFELYGSDIDHDAIQWCCDNLHHTAKFFVNEKEPPLAFKNRFFNVVVSMSVFTHLPEDMQFLWLEELRRVMAPGGLVFLTVRGPKWRGPNWRASRSDIFESLNERGIFHGGVEIPTMPSYYRTTVHSHDYIRERWSDFFDIIEILPLAIEGRQDLVIAAS